MGVPRCKHAKRGTGIYRSLSSLLFLLSFRRSICGLRLGLCGRVICRRSPGILRDSPKSFNRFSYVASPYASVYCTSAWSIRSVISSTNALPRDLLDELVTNVIGELVLGQRFALDNVPAIPALDQAIRGLAGLKCLGRLVELIHHIALGEHIAVRVHFHARVFVVLCDKRVKVLSGLDLLQRLVCLALCLRKRIPRSGHCPSRRWTVPGYAWRTGRNH